MGTIVNCENWGLHRFAITFLWPRSQVLHLGLMLKGSFKMLPSYVFQERPLLFWEAQNFRCVARQLQDEVLILWQAKGSDSYPLTAFPGGTETQHDMMTPCGTGFFYLIIFGDHTGDLVEDFKEKALRNVITIGYCCIGELGRGCRCSFSSSPCLA